MSDIKIGIQIVPQFGDMAPMRDKWMECEQLGVDVLRLNNRDWATYGVESAFPEDWHYAMNLIPNRCTDKAEVNRILGRVTDRMCELSMLRGNAAEVAAQIQPYIDAGANVIELIDVMPLVLDPADAQAGLMRQIDVCARIKQRNA